MDHTNGKQDILKFPEKRKLVVTRKGVSLKRPREIQAAWVFTRGDVVEDCPHCEASQAETGTPFRLCVVLNDSFLGVCYGCMFTGESTHCIFKDGNHGVITEKAVERTVLLRPTQDLAHCAAQRQKWLDALPPVTPSQAIDFVEEVLRPLDPDNPIFQNYVFSPKPSTVVAFESADLSSPLYVKLKDHITKLKDLADNDPMGAGAAVKIVYDGTLIEFLLEEHDLVYAALTKNPLFLSITPERKRSVIILLVKCTNQRFTFFIRRIFSSRFAKKGFVITDVGLMPKSNSACVWLLEPKSVDEVKDLGFVAEFNKNPTRFAGHNLNILQQLQLENGSEMSYGS
ncbi:hypothetical protein IFR05_003971 [Cadophora sp. M221]|nr:hypothetical protein IFR05_003971 [Cadophora sp. M221]